MRKRPEEVHALQEPQEQRRVPQRCEGTARVGHDEDEEHHHMGFVLAVVVGTDQGTNQQHRRPRRSHEAGQHCANGQQPRVEPWAAMQVALDVDAARHSKKCRQQDHKGDVLRQECMHQACPRQPGTKGHGKGNQEQQRPSRSHLAKMVVPEDGRHQRHDRDGQQNPGERNAPPQRQRTAVNIRCQGQLGKNAQSGQQQPAKTQHGFVSLFLEIYNAPCSAWTLCRSRQQLCHPTQAFGSVGETSYVELTGT